MPWEKLPDRVAHYRARAVEARAKANAAADEETRKSLLQIADTWERVADFEEKHNPPPR